MKTPWSNSSRPLTVLTLAIFAGTPLLSACDRQQEHLDRVQDIAEGVSEQVNSLQADDEEESAEDGNDN
ncbi:hypothetical protein [Henriciella barbarensis]|uniref:hypothetical protein n=1 Tax=Henriciella barbarensis TaxID=86342 RepID=UPI0011C382BD|nr:hypothetical protein [Henriciella barbarensis]